MISYYLILRKHSIFHFTPEGPLKFFQVKYVQRCSVLNDTDLRHGSTLAILFIDNINKNYVKALINVLALYNLSQLIKEFREGCGIRAAVKPSLVGITKQMIIYLRPGNRINVSAGRHKIFIYGRLIYLHYYKLP